MSKLPAVHSPAPWTFTEDELFYHVKDATGAPIAAVCKNTVPKHAQANLLAILSAPDVLASLRTQPAYSDDWKTKVRNAYACASGLVTHFLPARKKK